MARCDAIVEIVSNSAWVRALTPRARDWIEAHVTLSQVQTWANDRLEVPTSIITDLIVAMLTTGLTLMPASGRMIIRPGQLRTLDFVLCISPH